MKMKKTRKKLRGIVTRILRPFYDPDAEKAQVEIEGADDLYREIRVDNVVTDDKGEKARLKPGAKVDVIVEADPAATTPIS
jgi:hypothetical protein